jgi:hypothetical protein
MPSTALQYRRRCLGSGILVSRFRSAEGLSDVLPFFSKKCRIEYSGDLFVILRLLQGCWRKKCGRRVEAGQATRFGISRGVSLRFSPHHSSCSKQCPFEVLYTNHAEQLGKVTNFLHHGELSKRSELFWENSKHITRFTKGLHFYILGLLNLLIFIPPFIIFYFVFISTLPRSLHLGIVRKSSENILFIRCLRISLSSKPVSFNHQRMQGLRTMSFRCQIHQQAMHYLLQDGDCVDLSTTYTLTQSLLRFIPLCSSNCGTSTLEHSCVTSHLLYGD